jgi:hypothetical protein
MRRAARILAVYRVLGRGVKDRKERLGCKKKYRVIERLGDWVIERWGERVIGRLRD